MKKKSNLRSGYTTGACAAAAAKAAALLLLKALTKEKPTGSRNAMTLQNIEIPFPDKSRVKFQVHSTELITQNSGVRARASVIKDAGDDPDITHGAEIVAEASIVQKNNSANKAVGTIHELPLHITIKGGKGVGTVTKPGLAIPVGQAAINPVPREMIKEAVSEAINTCRGTLQSAPAMEITISVPKGEELAKKTLNYRLGIEGGISILGTTGIVKPVSTEAWTATITSSMDVAVATGQKEIVVSSGRTSEKTHMTKFELPGECYVLMGDYLEYSLKEAAKHGFTKIHLCAQWAKMVKIAMATPQTHVRFGAINVKKAVQFLNSLAVGIPDEQEYNTAREIFDYIRANPNTGANHRSSLKMVCNKAKEYAQNIVGSVPVKTYLISYDREIIASSE